MGFGKKCCCLLAVILAIVAVLALIFILLAVCVIPGFCRNISPVTQISASNQIYSGPDNYNVVAGIGYYYTEKIGQTGTVTYQVYYDGQDEAKLVNVDTTKYAFKGFTLSSVILVKKDEGTGNETSTVAVWDHDGKEIGTFEKATAETITHIGENWIISLDTAAKNYYFYQRNDQTYTKSQFTIIYDGSTAKRQVIAEYNEYDDFVLTYTADLAATPPTYEYTYWFVGSTSLEAAEEKLATDAQVFAGLIWKDKLIGYNENSHKDELKAFQATWGDLATHEWDVTIVPEEGYDLKSPSFDIQVAQRAWVVKHFTEAA